MDWQLTCRVCMETGDMVSLFDCDENNEQLADKYTFCCGVEVSKLDILPTLICVSCVDWLTTAYQFKQHCLTSNKTLTECLEEFNKNSECEPTASETVEAEMVPEYEVAVEDPVIEWTRTIIKTPSSSVVVRAPVPLKKGPRRKYPGIDVLDLAKNPESQDIKCEIEETLLCKETLDFDFKQEHDYVSEPLETGADDVQMHVECEATEEVPYSAHKLRKRQLRKRPKRLKDLSTSDNDDSDPKKNGKKKPEEDKEKKTNQSLVKRHICETCNTMFRTNVALQEHVRRHLNIKPFVCSVCGFSSVTRVTLKNHMKRHTGEKPYKCRICDRRFRDNGSRQKHEWVHMGVRPYPCTICDKSFTYSYVLANHMLTHTGERNYKCDKCKSRFVRPAYLKHHIKVFHRDLYRKQELEKEAKKAEQLKQVKKRGVISAKIVDGELLFVETSAVDAEPRTTNKRRLTRKRS